MAAKDRKCSTCEAFIYRDNKSGQCQGCRNFPVIHQVADSVDGDRLKQKAQTAQAILQKKYKESLAVIDRQEKQLTIVNELRNSVETYQITPSRSSGTGEATAVAIASDWHTEENVGAEVGGLNKFNVTIAKKRATIFFQATLKLVNLLAAGVAINTLVLALLGDFITNDIHEAENAEKNDLLPVHAIITAQNMIISGIDFLLANSGLKILIPCHSGNHSRTTKTTRFATENGHSLEYLMYIHLADHYRNEPRVTFIIPEGMHSYVQVYDTTIRFHHGHAVKYGGGVGGIYIPVNKAIAQWNKGRHADLDVFGHFHQSRDGGNFICNGSLIGYNAFALSIKADFENPKQTLFLIDKKRGRTCTWPIFLE